MVDVYKELVSIAYEYVEFSQELYNDDGNSAGFRLLIDGSFSVRKGDDQPQNYQAVLDAIHLYKKNNPSDPVKEAFEESFKSVSKLYCSKIVLSTLFRMLNYELYKENEKSNSFIMDVKGLLDFLKININENKEHIKKNFDGDGFENWYNEEVKILEKKLSRRILKKILIFLGIK